MAGSLSTVHSGTSTAAGRRFLTGLPSFALLAFIRSVIRRDRSIWASVRIGKKSGRKEFRIRRILGIEAVIVVEGWRRWRGGGAIMVLLAVLFVRMRKKRSWPRQYCALCFARRRVLKQHNKQSLHHRFDGPFFVLVGLCPFLTFSER